MLQLTCVLSLQRIVTSLSSWAAGLIVAIIMVPLAQIQNIHDVGSLSIVATVAMVAAAGIALIKLLAMPGNKLEQTSLLPPPATGHVSFLTSLMNLIFAFGGQVNWMRYESAMRSRMEFKYAVEVRQCAGSPAYMVVQPLIFKVATLPSPQEPSIKPPICPATPSCPPMKLHPHVAPRPTQKHLASLCHPPPTTCFGCAGG